MTGEEASDTINSFHSAVLQTPASLGGLAQGLEASSSSFATLLKFTSKSGEQFQEYKKDLLDLNVGLVGGLTKLGIGANKSGEKLILPDYKISLIDGNIFRASYTNLRQKCA